LYSRVNVKSADPGRSTAISLRTAQFCSAGTFRSAMPVTCVHVQLAPELLL